MSSQPQQSRFWLYFMVFMIFIQTMGSPNRTEVKRIVREACTSQGE